MYLNCDFKIYFSVYVFLSAFLLFWLNWFLLFIVEAHVKVTK
jgi:hypothetical protein